VILFISQSSAFSVFQDHAKTNIRFYDFDLSCNVMLSLYLIQMASFINQLFGESLQSIIPILPSIASLFRDLEFALPALASYKLWFFKFSNLIAGQVYRNKYYFTKNASMWNVSNIIYFSKFCFVTLSHCFIVYCVRKQKVPSSVMRSLINIDIIIPA
jgi:hypothetical protein